MILDVPAVTAPVPAIFRPWQGESGWNSYPTDSYNALAQPQLPQRAAAAAPPAWKGVTQKNFAAIAALAPGWDGYSAAPVDYRLVYVADRLLSDAFGDLGDFIAPYIIPLADGSLQFEWRTADFQLEFVLAGDGYRSFWLKNLRTSKEIESDGDEAVQLLYRWARQIAAKPPSDVAVSISAEEAELLFAA